MKTPSRLACHAVGCAAALFLGTGICAAQSPQTAANEPPATPTPADSSAPTPPNAEGSAQAPPDAAGAAAGTQKSEQAPETPPDGFRMGGFVFKPGGRVKLDVIRDFKPIGSEDSFDPRTIPLDGSEGTNSNVHAKETRLNLDIRGIVEERELRMFIETDFYGTSSALRLRHAYGSFGGLLAGQTWSTFVDDDNMPRTIDFEAPMAYASVRQAQARWTQKLTPSFTWAAAVEDNKSAIVIPSNVPGKAEYPMPDVVTRLRWDPSSSSHVMAAAFLGAARFRPTTGDPDSVTLWGSVLSGKFTTFGKDYVYGIFTIGEGIGRYRGGTTAIPDDTGALHAIGGTAYMGGYEHFWAERWSTNAVYSVTDTWDENFYTDSVTKQLNYGAVNLLYWFLGDRAWTGVEYIYGRREMFGADDPNGTAHRVQFAVRFNLP
jgi:hypothetical protein